jgi:predicted NAD/FAD-dependent oxidoreductase
MAALLRIGVVGGGVSGSVCAAVVAQGLRASGCVAEVHLLDAGRRLGGRAGTRVVDVAVGQAGAAVATTTTTTATTPPVAAVAAAAAAVTTVQYDHGAQFFRVSHPHVRQFVTSRLVSGLVGQWDGRLGVLGRRGGKFLPAEVIQASGVATPRTGSSGSVEPPPTNPLDFCGHLQGKPYLVGMPSMQALCEGVCSRAGVVVHSSTKVTKATWHPPTGGVGGGDGHGNGSGDGHIVAWEVDVQRDHPGPSTPTPTTTTATRAATAIERFDHLVLATHSPAFVETQLRALLNQHHHETQQKQQQLRRPQFGDAGGSSNDAVYDDDDDHDDDNINSSGGDDEVVLAVRKLCALLKRQTHRPGRTLMVTLPPSWAASLPPSSAEPVFDAAVVHGSDVIRWVARDSSKPGRAAARRARQLETFRRRGGSVSSTSPDTTSREHQQHQQQQQKQQQPQQQHEQQRQHQQHQHQHQQDDEEEQEKLGDCWVAHATDEFAQRWQSVGNGDAAGKQRICNEMLVEFLACMGCAATVTPLHIDTQRWGAGFLALDAPDMAAEFGGGGAGSGGRFYSVGLGRWDLSICGDYFGGSGRQTVESAILSGLEAAARLLDALAVPAAQSSYPKTSSSVLE